MTVRHDHARRAQSIPRSAGKTTVSAQEIKRVYRTLGLEDESSRRRYLDWSEDGTASPKSDFVVIERGDTRAFD